MQGQRRLKFWVGLFIVLVCLAATTRLAEAHAYLVKADPAPNSIVATAPKQVSLWFDEPVDAGFSRIQVLDTAQTRVDQGSVTVAPDDSKQLDVALKPLANGTYTVVWQILSSTDGHITRGVFAFSVGNASGPTVATQSEQSGFGESDPVSIFVRWLNLLSILLFAGTLFFQGFLLDPSLRAVDAKSIIPIADLRGRQLVTIAFTIALVSEIARLILETRLAAGAISPDRVADVLFNTRLGILWMTRFVALTAMGLLALGVRTRTSLAVALGESAALIVLYTGILGDPQSLSQLGRLWQALVAAGIAAHLIHIAPLFIFVVVIVFRDPTTRRVVTLMLAALVLLTLSLESHSAAQGDFSLAVLSDGLHLTAVSLWVGGLIALVWTLVPTWRALPDDHRRIWLTGLIRRFSVLGIASVVVIIATGLYAARIQIPSLSALMQTAYGETLLAKVLIFLLILPFAAVNLFRIPQLLNAARDPSVIVKILTRFRRLVSVEVALGVGVIALAGALTLLPPARSIQGTLPVPESTPGEPSPLLLVGTPTPDVRVALTISPTADSARFFDVLVTGPHMTLPGNILRVILEFTLLDQDTGVTRVDIDNEVKGHYTTDGNYMPLPGMWRIKVIVRRQGVEDIASEFPIYLAPPGTSQPANDAPALDLLRASDAQMNTLVSLRSDQYLNDGINGMVLTHYEYQAPDRLHFQVSSGMESIAIGQTQYYYDKNVWTRQARVDAFVFPDFSSATHASGARLGRSETLNGMPVQIVEFDDTSSPDTHYAYWIGTHDHRLYQLAMAAPGHFMVQYYFDDNAPIQISAPPNAVPGQ